MVHTTRITRSCAPAGIQAMNKRLEGCQRLRRSEGAMAGAMDKHLPQQTGVPCRANNARICLLVLVDYKPVASGMHGKYRHIQVAVEDNVVAEVVYRLWISVDAWSGCKGVQVIIQL